MLDILRRWNLWGSAKLSPGYPRDVMKTLIYFLDTPDIIALIGPRRAGKSTVLYQIMHALLAKEICSKKALLHINFEEPAFAAKLSLSWLDKLYNLYRSEVYPQGTVYLFLDEIQYLPDWERWVRARNESDDIKIFLTGSSSQLMSQELATLLTGRHLCVHVYPVSFSEQLQFQGITPPDSPQPLTAPPAIAHALKQYLHWGGFPEVVLSTNDIRRELLLKQYVDDILFKDIALRHQVRDMNTLRNLAIYLLTQTGSLVSFNRLANIFQTSVALAKTYANHLQEAFMIDWVPLYSLKAAERQRNPKKVHCLDIGLRQAIGLTHSDDAGRCIESIVFQALLRKENDGIFYGQAGGEIDLLVRDGNEISRAIQVTWGNLENPKVLKREISPLIGITTKYPRAHPQLITNTYPSENIQQQIEAAGITLTPLWRFLLDV